MSGRVKYTLGVKVTNTDIRLVKWCESVFGGKVYMTKKPTDGAKALFDWKIWRANAENILSGCLPFFIVKSEQAYIALEFQDTVSGSNRNRYKGTDMAVLIHRDELVSRLKAEKHSKVSAA